MPYLRGLAKYYGRATLEVQQDNSTKQKLNLGAGEPTAIWG